MLDVDVSEMCEGGKDMWTGGCGYGCGGVWRGGGMGFTHLSALP